MASHPIGMVVVVVLATPVKNYLKWWAILLAIRVQYRHSELPYICGEKRAGSSIHSQGILN